jgi:hypothetical protein
MGSDTGTKTVPSQRALLVKEKRKTRLRSSRRDFPISKYVVHVSQAAILIAVCWQVYRHVLEIRPMIAASFQFDYEEGNILNALLRITHGLSPYPGPHAFPNVLNPYGPVAYYLLGIPVRLLGLSFAGPRLMIVASMAAICIFIALLVAKTTRSALAGLAFGLIYATLGLVRDWSAILRVDFLALALATAGIFFFSLSPAARLAQESGNEDGKDPGFIFASVYSWLAAILFSAAILTKHTCIAAPAACVIFLLVHRRSRQALQFAIMGVALCFLGFATVFVTTHGAIAIHLFLSHPDPFSWSTYGERMAQMAWRFAPLLALALVGVVPEIARKKLSLPCVWLILSAATAVTAGKLGSNWNHFLEWPIALCICAGVGWSFLSRLKPPELAATLCVIATLWLGFMVFAQKQSKNPFAAVRECPAAYEFVRSQPGDRILSENVGALVLGGKKIWVSNLFVYSQLVQHAGWQDAGMKQMIETRSFDLIVTSRNYPGNKTYSLLGADRFAPEPLQLLAENYRAVAAFECKDAAFMFAPKP